MVSHPSPNSFSKTVKSAQGCEILPPEFEDRSAEPAPFEGKDQNQIPTPCPPIETSPSQQSHRPRLNWFEKSKSLVINIHLSVSESTADERVMVRNDSELEARPSVCRTLIYNFAAICSTSLSQCRFLRSQTPSLLKVSGSTYSKQGARFSSRKLKTIKRRGDELYSSSIMDDVV